LKILEQSNQTLKQLIASGSIEFSKLSSLANICLSDALIKASYDKKTTHYKKLLTYSPKVFIPLTFYVEMFVIIVPLLKLPKKLNHHIYQLTKSSQLLKRVRLMVVMKLYLL
jgi:hypothetical protein